MPQASDATPLTQEVKGHPLMLTGAECQVILAIRQLGYGSVEVKVEQGHPTFIAKIRENIRLTS